MKKKAHSSIGASSMYRWSACPGSVKLSEGIENRTSEYAAGGTVAHWLGETALSGIAPDTYVGSKRKQDGYTIEINDEMVDAVMVYVAAVKAIIASPEPGVLYVADYKHGAGLAVEVADNPQLMYYALGALMSKGKPGWSCEHKFDLSAVYPGLYGTADFVLRPAKITHVEMIIVQPRCPHTDGPVRRHRIAAIDLLDFSTDLVNYAKATEDAKAPTVPGDHCRFCPAAGLPCPALHKKAQAVAAQEFGPALAYDPGALAETLRWIPILKAFAKSVDEFAYAEAEAGRLPPGYKLVDKRATRKWRDPDAAIGVLRGLGLGEPELYGEPELRSPAQIEAVLKQLKMAPAVRKDALDPLCVQESSGHALVPDADKRPAVTKVDAATEFS